ncbi:hypothetical protein M0R72_12760 [Candidatus Pacearchaeota archaeon]|jgi:hypothetical protein|nr:hypothetical protein [Candidatus Pacearchaeota archaeon]
MKRHGFINLYVLAAVAVICLICLAIIARNWSCRSQRDRGRKPRPPAQKEYVVESASTGGSLVIKDGRKGKRVIAISLSGIAAPAAGEPLEEESRVSLEKLAGAKVRLESGRKILGATEDGDEDAKAMFAAPEKLGPGVEVRCSACGGKGENTYPDGGVAVAAQAAFAIWMDSHIPTCKKCKDAILNSEKSPPASSYCTVAQAKWKEICDKAKLIKRAPLTDECWACGGSGLLIEHKRVARRPLVGVVYGQSGNCLNEAQLRVGLARTVGTVCQEWADAEKEAQTGKVGIWVGYVSKPVASSQSWRWWTIIGGVWGLIGLVAGYCAGLSRQSQTRGGLPLSLWP